MFVTKQVLEEYFVEKKNGCGRVIYSNQEGNILVSTYTHVSSRVPELTIETPILVVRKDDTSVSITDTTKAREGISLTEYSDHVYKLEEQLRIMARLVLFGEFEGSFLQTITNLILHVDEEVSHGYETIESKKERSHPSSFEIGDLVWIDPILALEIAKDFSKEEELDNLVKYWREEKVDQLCFILERYLSWHGVKPEESPLSEFIDKTFSIEEYYERLEAKKEDIDLWIQRTYTLEIEY